MILRTKGPDRLPAGYEIVLYISMADSDRVGVFYVESEWPRPSPRGPEPFSAHRAAPPGIQLCHQRRPGLPYAVAAPAGAGATESPWPLSKQLGLLGAETITKLYY